MASSALSPYLRLRKAPRACLWGWRLDREESWGKRALFLISDLFFFNFRSFFLSHACMLSNFFLFLILEKHGNENNSSAALDIKMKDN